MLFAVAILGTGLALFSEIFQTSIKRQREAELIAIGHEFREAIRRYYEASPGGKQYPPSLQDLVLDPRFPTIRRHLRRIYVDPMTGKTDWGTVRVGGRLIGVHSLSNAEPLKVANFELVDISFSGRSKYSEWVFSYPESGVIPVGVPGAAGNIPGTIQMPGTFPSPMTNPASVPGANSTSAENSLTGNSSLFGSSLSGNGLSSASPAQSVK